MARASAWVLLSAILVQTLSFFLRYTKTGYGPTLNLYDSFALLAWAISGTYLLFQMRTRIRVLGAFISPVAFVLMVLASARSGSQMQIPHILQGSLVPIHVIFSILGESLFTVACLAGAMYLIQDNYLKHRKYRGLAQMLPPLQDLDRINRLALLGGFPFLTVGVLVGAIWARTAWGSHWSWDPKQVWTLIAWLLYAALLHQRLALGWNGRKAAVLSIAAFCVLLVAFIGVSLFFTTAHRFL